MDEVIHSMRRTGELGRVAREMAEGEDAVHRVAALQKLEDYEALASVVALVRRERIERNGRRDVPYMEAFAVEFADHLRACHPDLWTRGGLSLDGFRQAIPASTSVSTFVVAIVEDALSGDWGKCPSLQGSVDGLLAWVEDRTGVDFWMT